MLLELFSRQTTDSKARSLAKTLSWRALAALDTFAISFVVTGRFAGAATIVGVEAVTKILWYFLHERAWEHVVWGRYTPSWADHVTAFLNNRKNKSNENR